MKPISNLLFLYIIYAAVVITGCKAYSADLPAIAAAPPDVDLNLSVPAVFAITRPAEKLTTDYQSYFITGTSDPGIPLRFNGEEIERQGALGTFGVWVELVMGSNTFTFSQGNKTGTVTIVRVPNPDTVRISDIRQSSMFPGSKGGAKAGKNLTLSCVAPSGAAVTANFNGKSVELIQSVTASDGVPAVFIGNLPLTDDYKKDVTARIGPVSYSMTYEGRTKEYTSSGDVYVAGENSEIAVRVNSYNGFVYPDTKKLSVFKELLREGAVDTVKSMDNNYFELSSGGFIPVEMADIIEGRVNVASKLRRISFANGERFESYTFSCTKTAAYDAQLNDGEFLLTLYNTTGSPVCDVSKSALFSGATATIGEGFVTYSFAIKNRDKLWGWNISFNGSDTVLDFKYKPEILSSGTKPLDGVKIVLDPGHGGSDVGAIGVAGKNAPAESMVNLAHAYATRDELVSLGADVYITRADDSYRSLDDRMRDIEAFGADLFISLHHNSAGEDKDANKISGMEIYYHTGLSKNFAETMIGRLGDILGRKARFVSQSYYRVTLMPYSPAILIELGFLCNPLEYENSVDSAQIENVAKAISAGVKAALQ